MELARGANTIIDGTSLKVAVSGSAPGTVDLMVFQLDDRSKVRGDADFIFFNQPVNLYRSSFYMPRFGGTITITP